MNRRLVLTIIAVILFLVAATWLFVPGMFFGMFGIEPTTALEYMARRYAAYIFGLGLAIFLARDHANSPAGRALMTGGFVAVLLTSLASLYGGLALGFTSWFGFIGEFGTALLLGWALFLSKEPWS